MSKHTPESWLVDRHGRGFSVYTKENDHRIIAECNARNGSEIRSCEANARLIAAAPDLLESLSDILVELDHFGDVDPLASCVSDARAAIAKARGE